MKLNQKNVHAIGSPHHWVPADYTYYERQWRTQRGAWGDPGAVTRLQEDVSAVVAAFKELGARAGLAEAEKRGVREAARVYLVARADTEEELSVRLAAIRARLATKPAMLDKLREAFVEARLDEVREAGTKGHSAPQAVRDRPEIPRRAIPRWVTFTFLGLSIVGFLRSLK